MWRELIRNVLLMSLFGAILSGTALPAQAAVRDDAGFFSKEVLDKANTRLAELEKTYGKEVRIETFKNVPDGKGDEVVKMDKADRGHFFEKWAREQATRERVKGFYVLICKHPGYVEVMPDRQTQNQGIGVKERNEVRDKLLSGFRNEKYDQALLSAVDSLDHIFKDKLHNKSASHAPVTVPNGHQGNHHQIGTEGRGMGWLGWILVIGAVLLGIRLLGALFSGFGGGHPAGGGYGPGYGGGGGGGFFGSLMTGMLGAVAGNWLYHSMFGGSEAFGHTGGFGGGDDVNRETDAGAGDFDNVGSSGGDFDDSGSSGGDFGGDSGGDFGGGDFGGGDFGGGDFGGGGDF